MKIVCPSCASDYSIADHLLGPEGRKVKCANCSNVWRAMPEPEPEPPKAEVPGAPADDGMDMAAAMVESDVVLKDELFAAAPAPKPEADLNIDPALAAWNDVREGTFFDEQAGEGLVASGPVDAGASGKPGKPRKVKLKGQRSGPSLLQRLAAPLAKVATPAAVALGLGGVVLAIPQRDTVVAMVPDLAGLYEMVGLEVNVRGVSFSQFTAQRSMVAGLSVLEIAGTVTNTEDDPVPLGPLRLSLLSETGAELFVWQIVPAQQSLEPGESFALTSELTAPPESVASVGVRFLQDNETLPSTGQ